MGQTGRNSIGDIMRRLFFTGLGLLLFASGLQAQTADGGLPGAFLQVPTGARPTALGGAYLAISDDGAAPLFNPAGISGIKRPMISTAYRAMRFDRKLGYVTALFPVQGDAAIGIHWLYAGSGSVLSRDGTGAPTGEDFSLNQHQFAVIFAKRFEKYLSIGANINYLYATFPDVNVASVGFDFGAIIHVNKLFDRERQATMKVQDIRIGMVVKNLTKELNWNNEDYIFTRFPNTIGSIQDDKIPIEAGLGISARFLQRKLLLATDFRKNEKQSLIFRSGAEYFLTKQFALRGGFGRSRATAGAGFIFSIGEQVLSIDYAFSTDRVDEGSEHIFSFDLLL